MASGHPRDVATPSAGAELVADVQLASDANRLVDPNGSSAGPIVTVVKPPIDTDMVPEEDERLEPWLAHVSVLVHLATFAVIGVLIRYGLEILFGPEMSHVTDDNETVFIDLPANIVGCFIMGIVGVAAKRHISAYSEHLAIGLSTGLCGCLTTFASWNQRMLAIEANGLWVRGICGYIVGAALPFVSLIVGIDVADGVKWLVQRTNDRRARQGKAPLRRPRADHFDRRWGSLLLFFCVSVFLATGAAIGTALDTTSDKRRRLWFALVVAPPGAWMRWYLSWLNGGAVGKGRWWHWVPVGTMAANVSAAVLEAALSTVVLAVDTSTARLVIGALQLGFFGSLSTVSTLMVEVLALHKAKQGRCWRPYTYLYGLTVLPSFVGGVLVYCVPVWVLNYKSKYNHL
eukprot:TRINITY_DN16703_c0_g1_i1.p1 TRINITY_DN16703_c0_g1~~TRINITY_DN16703_c0_g1_i1.p1  ORF type:complete len:402 (-),score=10.72 TRINITY_DN16703_c0_g1_i1:291-1496(-)